MGLSVYYDIFSMLRLKAVVTRAVNFAGEDNQRLGNLQPLRAIFESPCEQAVCKFMWNHWDFECYGKAAKEESEVCRIVAPYVDR